MAQEGEKHKLCKLIFIFYFLLIFNLFNYQSILFKYLNEQFVINYSSNLYS